MPLSHHGQSFSFIYLIIHFLLNVAGVHLVVACFAFRYKFWKCKRFRQMDMVSGLWSALFGQIAKIKE